VKFVSDEAGEILSHYQYDAYGLRQVIGSDDDRVRFVGRGQIGELIALDARIYDPAVGRFLSPDPVLQTVNQYAYTLGNPVWFADASGRDFEAILDGITATGGLVAATPGLFFVTSPGIAVVAGVGMTLAGLNFALWVARRIHGAGAGPTGIVFAGPGQGTSRDPGGASGADLSCSPLRLASAPGFGSLHWLLIAAQILLAPLLIRSWAARRQGRSR
jgi:RHS repeat-associated protein